MDDGGSSNSYYIYFKPPRQFEITCGVFSDVIPLMFSFFRVGGTQGYEVIAQQDAVGHVYTGG